MYKLTFFAVIVGLVASSLLTESCAATFVVNTNSDTQDTVPGNGVCADAVGACSLRAAITETNALAGADVITLPAGTYTATLVSPNDDNNLGGDFDLNSEIAIDGAGPLQTIVQANSTRGVATERVFHLRAALPIMLNGLTIRYGRYTTGAGQSGAGIRIDSAGVVASLERVRITENDSGTSGGGLDISSLATFSIITLNNCRVENNTAGGTTASVPRGGGIRQDAPTATLNITDSVISGNVVASNSTIGDVAGGGILSNGILNITNSVISDNIATTSGSNSFSGGVFVQGGPANILGSTIINNMSIVTAGTGRGFAGGLYNQESTLSVTNSIVSGNTASHRHAGIRTLASSGGAATTTITDSTISDNTAGDEGGGVANVSAATFPATTIITGSTISGNAANDPSSLGGGLKNFNASTGLAVVNVTNSTFSGNVAASGAGSYNSGTAAASINFNYVTIADNTAALDGGGISQAVGGGTTNLKNSIVANNAAANGPDISGTATSQGYNHVENVSGGTFNALGGDITGTDPQLFPFGNYGGTTMTYLPVSSGPITNAIPNGTSDCGVAVTTSQNGNARPRDSLCEKGSVEVGEPSLFRDGFDGQ